MLLVKGKNCHDSSAAKKDFLKIFFKKHLTIFYTGYNIILEIENPAAGFLSGKNNDIQFMEVTLWNFLIFICRIWRHQKN